MSGFIIKNQNCAQLKVEKILSNSQNKIDTFDFDWICSHYDSIFPNSDIEQNNMNVSKKMLRIFGAQSKGKVENTEPRKNIQLFL